ncbi:HAMP domain-containing sensor histidine kinase [Streptomyces axinellae]|uniref:histidine kinase n=1 Tax=Streptomyces axinellae TaxID=552788 RepID=A0ABN3PY26_9ACTN
MRRQLLALIGTTTVVVLVVLLVPLALLVRSHAEDRAMTDATERAQSVAAVVGGSLGRGASGRAVVQGVVDGLNGHGQPCTSVVLADGTVLGRGTSGVSADALKLARGGRAFTYAPDGEHSGGRVVMVPVLASGAQGKDPGRTRGKGAGADAGGGTEAGADAGGGTEAGADAGGGTGAGADAGGGTEAGADAGGGTGAGADAGGGTEAGADAGGGTGAGADAGGGSEAGADAGGGTGAGADAGGGSEAGAGQGRAAGHSASVVEVAVSEKQLHAGVLPSWLAVCGLGVALMLLGLAFADRLAARLVRATRQLAFVSDRLAGGELTARATPSGPRELRQLAGRLNELGERIDGLVTAERERGADLAHRLRTPVAALRLDAEGLHDADEAARIGESVAALERSVDGVIRAARRAGAAPGTQRGDLAAVARERTAFWTPLAEDQSRTVTVSAPPGPVWVRASRDELSAVLDTLIGNVLDHTPEGAGLWITVTPDGLLAVEDEGPGFADGGAEVAARGESGAGSTGLGLDIARTTAEDSGGGVELGTSAHGGAEVRCRFGACG